MTGARRARTGCHYATVKLRALLSEVTVSCGCSRECLPLGTAACGDARVLARRGTARGPTLLAGPGGLLRRLGDVDGADADVMVVDLITALRCRPNPCDRAVSGRSPSSRCCGRTAPGGHVLADPVSATRPGKLTCCQSVTDRRKSRMALVRALPLRYLGSVSDGARRTSAMNAVNSPSAPCRR